MSTRTRRPSAEHSGTDNAVTAARWNDWAKETRAASVVKKSASDPNATPCPDWCNERPHTAQRLRRDRLHRSGVVSMALSNHLGSDSCNGKMLLEPLAEVVIAKPWNRVEPFVQLRRRAEQLDGSHDITTDSLYSLTLAEAAELGRILLAAVDVALGLGEVASQTDEAAK
jgi:hypothetical protein